MGTLVPGVASSEPLLDIEGLEEQDRTAFAYAIIDDSFVVFSKDPSAIPDLAREYKKYTKSIVNLLQ